MSKTIEIVTVWISLLIPYRIIGHWFMQNSDNVKQSLCTPIDHKPCRPHLSHRSTSNSRRRKSRSSYFLFSFSESHWKLLEAYRRCVRRHERWNCSQFQQKERKKNFVKTRREEKRIRVWSSRDARRRRDKIIFSKFCWLYSLHTETKKLPSTCLNYQPPCPVLTMRTRENSKLNLKTGQEKKKSIYQSVTMTRNHLDLLCARARHSRPRLKLIKFMNYDFLPIFTLQPYHLSPLWFYTMCRYVSMAFAMMRWGREREKLCGFFSVPCHCHCQECRVVE